MKGERKIAEAAVAFVKAYRREQIAGMKDPLDHGEVRHKMEVIILTVDEAYKPDDDGLIPPDLEQCQAEKQEGSFMTLGPRGMIRCKNVPTVVLKENQPGEDGKTGSMSLCDECLEVFKKKMPDNYATFTPIQKEEG